MMRMDASRIDETEETLGQILSKARRERGFTFKQLAEKSGLLPGQINKLANDRRRKPNPAHLAALAGPLQLSVYQLYKAAGYETPLAVSQLGGVLERKLLALPPEALVKLERYVDALATETASDGA